MNKKISIILLVLVLLNFLPSNFVYGNSDIPDYLDVKIGQNFKSTDYITLTSENGFYIYNKFDKQTILSSIIDRNIIIKLNNYGEFDVLDLQNNVIRSIPSDGSEIIGSGSMYDSIVEIESKQYRGFITFIVNSYEISLINHIKIEDYLYGVVPKEMGSSFHIESLKAQAVAARTYAIFAVTSKNKHKKDGFDLCDTIDCQAYGGKNIENTLINSAVDETRGQYVYYEGKLAETFFHANNGGYMESSENIWGGYLGYLIAKEDPFSKDTTASTWQVEFTSEDINKKIISARIYIGDILDIKVLERNSGNRVKEVKLIGKSGEKIISGSKLRTILGIRSTWFNIVRKGEQVSNLAYVFDPKTSKTIEINLDTAFAIDKNDNKFKWQSKETQEIKVDGFLISGRGYGHGVGMSQYGALEMAKQGYNYEEIIKFYYTGADIVYNGK